jgi:hypothetical protein
MGKSAISGFFKRRGAAQRLDLALNVLLIGRTDVLTLLKEKHAKDWDGFVAERLIPLSQVGQYVV